MPTVKETIIELLEMPMDEVIAVTVVTKFGVMAINQCVPYGEEDRLTEEECEAVVKRVHSHHEHEAVDSVQDCINAELEERES